MTAPGIKPGADKQKHNAPSAHQNTALNTHAISCQNVRWVTKNSRIVTMQTGAASIAPSKGRSTRRPGERQLAAAHGSKKKSRPSSGLPLARNAPFICNNNDKHTTMNRTKPQIMPAQLRSDFTVSS